jgi:hypothetical protein
MNLEPVLATISKSQLEGLLHDGVLTTLGYTKNLDGAVVELDVPSSVPFKITYKEAVQ